MVVCAGPEFHSCQANNTVLILPLVSYNVGACMGLALRRFASAGMSGKMTSCLAAGGGKASISPKSSEAWPAARLRF